MKMKKFALSLVAVAACTGAFRAYESYQQSGESDALLAENVEALSNAEWDDMYDVRGDKNGKCFKYTHTDAPCTKHTDCVVTNYTLVPGGYTYQKIQVKAIVAWRYYKWTESYGRCPSGYTRYGINESVKELPAEHNWVD